MKRAWLIALAMSLTTSGAWTTIFAAVHGHPPWIGTRCCGEGHCIPAECARVREEGDQEVWEVRSLDRERAESRGWQRLHWRREQIHRDNPTGQCWYCGARQGGFDGDEEDDTGQGGGWKVEVSDRAKYCLFPGTLQDVT